MYIYNNSNTNSNNNTQLNHIADDWSEGGEA